MALHPFLIVVDDGGFERAIPEDPRSVVGVDTYERIAELGRRFHVRIPVCFTLKSLDRLGRWGPPRPLPYLCELFDLLAASADCIEFGYHGLCHEQEDGAHEFFDLRTGQRVPEATQRRHFEISRAIIRDCGLDFPRVFVPPYNAWEQGVTDRIAAESGVSCLLAYRSLRYMGRRYAWRDSPYLEVLPRTSLGVNGNDLDLHAGMSRAIRFGGRMPVVQFMERHVIPQRLPWRVRMSKTLKVRPVHSYMTHIGNFSARAMDCWNRLFEYVLQRKDLKLCTDWEQAAELYRTWGDWE